MATEPGSTESSNNVLINRRRLTLSMFSSREKEKDRRVGLEKDVDAIKTEKASRKKSQVPSGGRGGLGNIRASRSCAPPSTIDPELAKILNPANFSLPGPADVEPDISFPYQNSTSSILPQATLRSDLGSFSSEQSDVRPSLSISTSFRSSSGSGSSVFSVFRRSAASKSSSSFATTCPSVFSNLRLCEQSEAESECCSSDNKAIFIASRPRVQQRTEHSLPPSPVVVTPGTPAISPSLHRMASSLSHTSSGTSSSNSSTSVSFSTELLQRLESNSTSADVGTAAAYATHLRLDARARRALHHSNINRLGRVDEELEARPENAEGETRKRTRRKGKKRRNDDSSPNQYIVRVRTGRGGAGIAYQKDGIDAVDPETHPMAAALTRNNAVRTALQEQEILEASRARARMVIRTGRGGAGSINMTKAKAMAKHVKKTEAAKEAAQEKKRGGFSLWLRNAKHDAVQSPLSEVEEQVEALAIDGVNYQGIERNVDKDDEANSNMAGIGAHKISSAIQSASSSHVLSYRHRKLSSEGYSLYNRSVRGIGRAAFDDVIMSLPDGIDIDGISLVFDDDEEEQEDDSDLDPELSPTAEHFHFKEYAHRCERVDAGGGNNDGHFSAHSPKQEMDDESLQYVFEAHNGPSDLHYGSVELDYEKHRSIPRLGIRCAPTRPPPPPPTSALPPVPSPL